MAATLENKNGNGAWQNCALGEGNATACVYGGKAEWAISTSAPSADLRGGVILPERDKPFVLAATERLWVKAPANVRIAIIADTHPS